MKRQGGFTLIELVVVIVILGILAVTAAPRFLNLQDDARNSALEGLKGAIAGAAGITYGKAAIDGLEASGAATLKTTNGDVAIVYGYPKATSSALSAVVEGLAEDWKVISGGSGTTITYGYEGYDKCYVTYTQAGVSKAASTVVEGSCKN
ncbi:type II secretion system protein [Vibrio parahaemolyticus]|uniref:type II secretion system protein n=1 Tax=Vibrio parahaemolyticus TaxID=670 RepID=UPI0002A58101|nr:type II secretion system protein [Vibrio parahaemolyticus]AGB10973.1 MSHA pilin protein MshA [Vibrio parahaemolyticus BB22OP]EGR0438438.1 type II secretion system protein [Vibrio parahaemolyticus]EGR0622592.1 type II secretion system protein [Vibrio parahaemolyticus]EGR0763673.1 type II secretion system protein [Vibrio parahaemolyticus]EGR2567743.1 type II secretion system protein [Vibrio parahaemolyticus]